MSAGIPPPHEPLIEDDKLTNNVWYRYFKENIGGANASGALTIKQIVTSVTSVDLNNSTTVYTVSTGNSISITPSSTASMIWVKSDPIIGSAANGVVASAKWARSTVANTNMIGNEAWAFGSGNQVTHTVSLEALDSPVTTSQVTYTIQARAALSAGAMTFYGGSVSVPIYAVELSSV